MTTEQRMEWRSMDTAPEYGMCLVVVRRHPTMQREVMPLIAFRGTWETLDRRRVTTWELSAWMPLPEVP